jgi:hypothetical protein
MFTFVRGFEKVNIVLILFLRQQLKVDIVIVIVAIKYGHIR